MKTRLLVAAIAFTFTSAGFAQAPATKSSVDDAAFGLAKGSVFDTPTPRPYAFEGAGAGKLIPPPPGTPIMVPHAIDSYLPLATDRNACLGCHDRPADVSRKVAKGAARPMPTSHYTTKEGRPTVNGAQYLCTACHAPQAAVAPLVGNTASPTR